MAPYPGSSAKTRLLERLAWRSLALSAALIAAFGCDPAPELGSASQAPVGPGAEETGARDEGAGATNEAIGAAPPGSHGTPTVAPDSGGPPAETTCDVQLAPDPDAEAKAKTALAALAPLATMSFSATRGTLTTVSGMNVVISSCADGGDAPEKALIELVKANPALFRIDPSEWETAAPACQTTLESEWLTWNRVRYGAFPVRRDDLAMHFRRTPDGIVLDALYGTYLPPASPAIEAAMSACPTLDATKAESIARATKHHYTVYDYCTPLSSGDYAPAANDAFVPLESYWEWTEAGGSVRFDSRQHAALRVAPSNYTADLVASDANCSASGQNNVAFTLLYDAAKSSLLESHPGEGCVVCLASGKGK